MSHRRPILLAEDNPREAELVRTALREAGVTNQLVVAHDGEVALDYLYRRGTYAGHRWPVPAVVFLDLNMPRVDGRAVLREIRASAALRSTPVVVLTSSRDDSDRHQSYCLGANAYVVKPLLQDDFVASLRRLGTFWGLLNEPPPAAAGA